MFDVGRFRARTCGGTSRRAFLRIGASLPLALGAGRFARVAGATDVGRAKSVLFVWLWGAPSHIDTFDPKPDAPAEFRGPFSPIATRTPGVAVTELFPRLAERSGRYALIRSHVTGDSGHPQAGTIGLTGFKEIPEPAQPHFGSIVAKHRSGAKRGSAVGLPPFLSIGRGVPRDLVRRVSGYGGGTLGRAHDPFLVSCSDAGDVDIPALQLLDGLSPNRLDDRRRLLASLDESRRTFDRAGVADWNRTWRQAYALLSEPAARDAFDVGRESETVRRRYGRTTFGQSCLLARRLVEAGVPFVQVNWSEYVEAMSPGCDFGWDTHIYNFDLLQDRHGPIFDRAFSALLDDLDARGLLDTTLVVAMGEFGRTPKINGRAARDHWARCYFSLWSGAGVRTGRVIGASDRLAQDPVTPPITPLKVGTTIAQLAGIDTQARAEMNVLAEGTVIDELF